MRDAALALSPENEMPQSAYLLMDFAKQAVYPRDHGKNQLFHNNTVDHRHVNIARSCQRHE